MFYGTAAMKCEDCTLVRKEIFVKNIFYVIFVIAALFVFSSCSDTYDDRINEKNYISTKIECNLLDSINIVKISQIGDEHLLIQGKGKEGHCIYFADTKFENVKEIDFGGIALDGYVYSCADNEGKGYIIIQNMEVDGDNPGGKESNCKYDFFISSVSEEGEISGKKEIPELNDIANNGKYFYIDKIFTNELGNINIINWEKSYCLNVDTNTIVPLDNPNDFQNNSQITEEVKWADVGINPTDITSLVRLENDEYILLTQNNEIFRVYQETDNAEKRRVSEEIYVGLLDYNPKIERIIAGYNSYQSEYRVKIVNYYDYDDIKSESEYHNLDLDIVSGKCPDIIVSEDIFYFSNLINKGVFVDLYSLMDGNPGKDDFIPNIISALEKDNKLYAVPDSFNIITYAVKSKYNVNQGWSVDDAMSFWNDNKTSFFLHRNNSKNDVFDLFRDSQNRFVDSITSSCDFSNSEFMKILDFCNTFPDRESEIYAENFDYLTDNDDIYRKDEVLVKKVMLHDIREYWNLRNVCFGEEITFAGIPSSGGNGAVISFDHLFGIYANSKQQENAWRFLEYMFTELDQEQLCNGESFSVIDRVFEIQCDDAMKNPHCFTSDGKKQYLSDEVIQNKECKLSKTDREFMEEYIRGASARSMMLPWNVNITIDEELNRFFNGELSTQQCADNIQSRVSIYFSEIK